MLPTPDPRDPYRLTARSFRKTRSQPCHPPPHPSPTLMAPSSAARPAPARRQLRSRCATAARRLTRRLQAATSPRDLTRPRQRVDSAGSLRCDVAGRCTTGARRAAARPLHTQLVTSAQTLRSLTQQRSAIPAHRSIRRTRESPCSASYHAWSMLALRSARAAQSCGKIIALRSRARCGFGSTACAYAIYCLSLSVAE